MYVVDIYIVCSKSFETLLDLVHDMFSTVSVIVRLISHWKIYLRCKDNAILFSFYSFSNDLFGSSLVVNVCRIYEISTRVQKSFNDPYGFILGCGTSEVHGSKAQLQNSKTCLSKLFVIHNDTPLIRQT